MKNALGALGLIFGCFVLGSGGYSVAQDKFSSCSLCATVVDSICSAHSDCGQIADVEKRVFIAPCTGTFVVECSVVCADRNQCSSCVACSRLEDASTGQVIAASSAVVDGAGGCEGLCAPDSRLVRLFAGRHYTLKVTLYHCRDDYDCSTCSGAHCKAVARVYSRETPCD